MKRLAGALGFATVLMLSATSHAQSGSPVFQILRAGRDVRTRVQAALTLTRLHPAGTLAALEAALDDSSPAVRVVVAQGLQQLGDANAIASLRAHANDHDASVRTMISRAITQLESSANASAVAQSSASEQAPVAAVSTRRHLVRVGSLANRVDSRATVVELLRVALNEEVSRHGDMTLNTSPPSSTPVVVATTTRRSRRRARPVPSAAPSVPTIDAFVIEGGVSTLRRWTVANTVSVRAEVALVLVTEGNHQLVASVSGGATAQDNNVLAAHDDTSDSLERRAVQGAVRSALGNLGTYLAGRH